MDPAVPLWRPSPARIAESGIARYMAWLAAERGLHFADYESLWRWSVSDLEAFWSSIWTHCGMIGHAPWTRALDARQMPGARWFEGATVNFAEQCLAPRRWPECAGKPALVFQSEVRPRTEIGWDELAARVGALTRTLRALGVRQGDRVVAYMPNIPETVVALMAVASVGAVWSACSPDMGTVSVLDRFRQIEPRVLLAVDGYRYGGKDYDRRAVVRELLGELHSVEHVVFVPYLDPGATLEPLDIADRALRVTSWAEAVAEAAPPEFTPVPFDQPLWIVYSSGTTGLPKAIVHGHGGITIEYLKTGRLHFDIGPRDRFFWFSSTSWVMWNILVATLMHGVTVLQFDGNPGHPDLDTLWRLASGERATFFGMSPAFATLCMKAGLEPGRRFDLSALRAIGATGSPLTEDAYRWLYSSVHPDVMLSVISGGTDTATAFIGGCPILPIYAGEMPCRCLGSATYSFDEAGKPLIDEVGELVVTEPMPSMPLFFWGDEDGRRYRDSYFDVYPGIWRHGDWLRLIPRPESVTSVIYGRSDSTINRHGIRMGTSELYRVVEELDEVVDSLVVDLEYLGRESFMALFVVLRDAPQAGGSYDLRGERAAAGATGVDPALRARLLAAVRTRLSARHVPNEVFAIPEVPRTISGKKLEVPIKKILLGHPVEKSLNRDSMSNPQSIEWFVGFARGRRPAGDSR